MPRKKREEYNAYMAKYMREYRAFERSLLKKAKANYGWVPPRAPPKKRKKKGA